MDFLNQAGNYKSSNILKLLKQGYIKKSKIHFIKILKKKDKKLINFLILNNLINYSNINKTKTILKKTFPQNLLYLKYFDNKPILF